MTMRYLCKAERRVAAVRDTLTNPQPVPVNGIDYLEIVSFDQRQIDVFFVHPLPGQTDGVPAAAALSKANFRIEGGDRITGIRVTDILSTAGNRIRLEVDAAGDFSTYALRLVRDSDDAAPPTGFDPQLASVDFLFKAGCLSIFDCAPVHLCPPEQREEPRIDYLAKDYAGFRRVMLDRLAALMPEWHDRSPADPYVAMVEALAFGADRLSYMQDAAGTEAYLGTARSRISLRRHARLIDYTVDEGANARTFAHFTITAGSPIDLTSLPAGQLLVGLQDGQSAALPAQQAAAALRSGAPKFETMASVRLSSAHNAIGLYGWSDGGCCLPPGSVRATLVNQPTLSLAAGDFLLFEQTASPETGAAADADPASRHVVRLTQVEYAVDPVTATPVCEVVWDSEDALPFALPIDAIAVGGTSRPCALARGNIVPADAGYWAPDAELLPDTPDQERRYRPVLAHRDIVFAAPYDAGAPAARLLLPGTAATAAAIRLTDAEGSWLALRDLLEADRFARVFVPEVEHDGTVTLRFGDDSNGARPIPGRPLAIAYRVGGGEAGNIGRDVLRHILAPPAAGIIGVTNPLPGIGGRRRESAKHIRRFAPSAIAVQDRAVTEADYARVVEELPGVQRAQARIRWTGSWYTVFIIVDRIGGGSVVEDSAFSARLLAHLNAKRMAGYDLDISDPVTVALDLAMHVCVEPDAVRADVRQRLERLFSARLGADGTPGFFHPDRRSFGDPLYASEVLAAAKRVPGVRSAILTRFARSDSGPVDPVTVGVIAPADIELLRLDNDPDHPDRGRMTFDLEGGR